MSNFVDLSGHSFSYLTVLHRDINPKHKRVMWKCVCKCGNTTVVSGCDLKSGHTMSCGCKKFESHNATHGLSKSRMYYIWDSMVQRCYNPNNKSYNRYGSRGITMCDEWHNSFKSFNEWAMSNGYSANLSIDRIDNDGNYTPDNCRWVDFETQVNNRRTNIRIQHNGKDLTLAQWCRINGADYKSSWAKRKKIIESKGVCSYDDIF